MTGIRMVWALFTAAPMMTLAGLWWAAVHAARKMDIPEWMIWLGPIALVWFLHRKRKLRGTTLAAVGGIIGLLWAGLLWSSPGLRFAVGLAIPVGLAAAGWVWLVSNYPHLPPTLAVQVAIAERRHREVLSDAVHASAGEGARVSSLTPLADGQFEAEIIGPAGMPHADLVEALTGSLAESILSQSGRVMRDVAVVGAGAKGSVRVRCSTSDPYKKTMRLEDMR